MASTGKIAEVMFENALESHEDQTQLIEQCDYNEPNPATLQNSSNVIWQPVQQHSPLITGFDLTGLETDIIEETVPHILGTPTNDFVRQRADDMRDTRFWERRGKEAGKKQASQLNLSIANAVATQGSLFYRSNDASGYDFISEAQAQLNERQTYESDRCFVLNNRDTKKFGSDLAGRQTLQGQPADTWKTGMIGKNIAEFDVYTGSYLPNLVGGASPDTTVTGNQSFKPEGGSVDQATGVVTNVDYRSAVIPVAASASYNVGDKVTMGVNALSLMDKEDTGQLMTFTIVAKPSGTSITVYPKPIAADDGALSTLEKAYANVDTTIAGTTVVARLNIDASAKSNIFFDKSAVSVLGGTIPAHLFRQFDGMKVIEQTMANGLTMYMVYDGEIDSLSFRFRIFTWYGVNVVNPSAAGTALTF